MKTILGYVAFAALFLQANGLDLTLKSISCDESLPAYIKADNVAWECSDGTNACSLGDYVSFSGGMTYNGLDTYGIYNNTGYATAELQLLTVDYELFELLPFNFCGNFVNDQSGYYSNTTCPGDGYYNFHLAYQLPENDDKSTWFATGWTATTEFMIFSSRYQGASILADCKLEFHTSVSQAQQTAGWKSLPSAAIVTLSLLGAGLCMILTICVLACRPKKKRATDIDYGQDFKRMDETDGESVESDKVQKARKVSVQMRYNGEADWS